MARKIGKYSEKLRLAVIELGDLATPHYLAQLMFTRRMIEKAVRDGVVSWTRWGGLRVTTDPTTESREK